MKQNKALQNTSAGYVTIGMKLILNLDLIIKIHNYKFFLKVVLNKIFIFTFSLKVIYLVYLATTNKSINLKVDLLFQIETFTTFLLLTKIFMFQNKKKFMTFF